MSVLFPSWMNKLPPVLAVGGALFATGAVGGFWYYATPKFWRVGYMPTQPGGGFNHQIHAGKLGMDCRYCHTKVEKSYEANIPNVATCYGCHGDGKLKLLSDGNVTHKERTEYIRTAFAADESIAWTRVHKLPDYVHNFPHQVHLNAGVSCYSCHGRIDTMPIVYHAQPLSMSFCLDCHRDPASVIVPKDKVTDLQWVQDTLKERAAGTPMSAEAKQVMDSVVQKKPPENCGACHY